MEEASVDRSASGCRAERLRADVLRVQPRAKVMCELAFAARQLAPDDLSDEEEFDDDAAGSHTLNANHLALQIPGLG
jgi:hypothetical protein